MIERIIIAGAGGQGIMLLGKVLAEAAMKEDKFITWLPSYGAEVRGGTAHCMVVVSDSEIGSAYVSKADALIIMNAPSLNRFKARLKKNGLLIANSSLTGDFSEKNARVSACPFSDMACALGNIKVANMIALGCFAALTGIVQPQSLREVIREIAPADKRELVTVNLAALEQGIKLM
ncbi:MAG: 2-oxoacid:acceptor oxidoreductase family protein [Candidatus Omnitrophota bacterium]|nr:2-oxoacid:acceptor oxidoreductase family protein [Candidatus Omnitrophota bacterium]